ncbi:MAG: MBL fold metallo-hydrolase [Bacillota bacterium]|nr:MBL fold metallo-hydrolase [Bacillota bacterium]
MKITFLGTSHGYVEVGRHCTSTLIEAGEKCYLIDAGAPVESLMLDRGRNAIEIDTVFITHMHGDHINYLGSIIRPAVLRRNHLNVYFPSTELMEGYKAWAKVGQTILPNPSVDIYAIDNKSLIFDDGILKVTAIPNKHMPEENGSHSFILEASGKKVLFTGDLKCPGIPDYPEIAYTEDFDLIICEMAHYDMSEAFPRLSKSKTKKMIFHHIYPPKLEGAKEYFSRFPFDVYAAKDNDEVVL